MHIVCPALYNVLCPFDLATLGAAGRTGALFPLQGSLAARPQDAGRGRSFGAGDGCRGHPGTAAAELRSPRKARNSRSGEQDPPYSSTAPRYPGTGPPMATACPQPTTIGGSSIAGPQVTEARAAGRRGRPWRRKPSRRPGSASRPAARAPDGLCAMGALVAGTGDLACRRGPAAAADRRILPTGRPRGEPARARVPRTSRSPTRPWKASRRCVIEGMIEGRSQKAG